jgi:hypothetical protein
MRTRLTKMGAALAALAALAVGGSALASASQKAGPPAQAPAATQGPTGNQSVPNAPAEAPDGSAEAQSGAADTDNVQQGNQTGTDQVDSQSEQAGSESPPSDGPGGYADTNPNADTQQQGAH